ncbi:MAG TPA: DUF5522 domain-containing protein [Acidobacteriaceae bacterium]|jgi:hypothetical protein|nr:DUF5522 domain-containing protein [Acidobacteriaceae bacterium]
MNDETQQPVESRDAPRREHSAKPPANECTHPPQPLAPEDFYYEGSNIVFTEAYHRKRGYCCNSGCRHCPFEERPPRR